MFIGSLVYGFINSSILALLAMGFNRVYPPFIAPEVPISDLKTDLGVGGD